MISRRSTLGILAGAASASIFPALAQNRRPNVSPWTLEAQLKYSREVVAFLNGAVEGTREVDCADLAIIGLIDFAKKERLPLRLYDGDVNGNTITKVIIIGKKRLFRFFPEKPVSRRYDHNPDEFEARVLPQLGAINLWDENTISVGPAGSLRAGDLLVTRSPGAIGYTGHTRIVTKSAYDPEKQDWKIDWIQGSGSSGQGSIPQRQEGYAKEIQADPTLRYRRWKFDNFVWA